MLRISCIRPSVARSPPGVPGGAGTIHVQEVRFDEAVLRLHELGAVLLAAATPSAAEVAYREDLRRLPENGWSLHGLARALREQGRGEEAAEVEARFDLAWTGADVQLDNGGL